MKAKLLPLFVLAASCLCGCQTYEYRIVRPAVSTPVVDHHPVAVQNDPLEYRFSDQQGRLGVRVSNPTAERVVLLGSRSYVTDPEGESHPIHGRVIGPHSYIRMLLPPIPFGYAYPGYAWGWGVGSGAWPWGWGWPGYDPAIGLYPEAFIGPPPLVYEQATTAYDWRWKRGPVHLHLTYQRGRTTFDHEFEIDREPRQ